MERLGSRVSRSPANSAARTMHDRDDLSQSPLQHLAQDAGVVAKEGDQSHGYRVPEDAAQRRRTETTPGETRPQTTRAPAQEGGQGSRSRQARSQRRPAHRRDGEAPHRHRAADRGERYPRRPRPPARGGAQNSLTTPSREESSMQ